MKSGCISAGSLTCYDDAEIQPSERRLVRSDRKMEPVELARSYLQSSPDEVKLKILSLLGAKEIVRVSVVCKEWHNLCFDGSLWMCFDAAPFYHDIPASELVRIICGSGRFIRHLNLRGCTQLDHRHVVAIARSCASLESLILEGCRAFDHAALTTIISNNPYLTSLDLSCLPSVTNSICRRIASSCPQLASLDLSWCYNMDSRGLRRILDKCSYLQELRLCECHEVDCNDVMDSLHRANKLEVLDLAGCQSLTDESLQVLLEGLSRRSDGDLVALRHLNISRCPFLTTNTLKNLADKIENLEYLELAALNITDIGFSILMPTLHHLTHLDCEDCTELTDSALISISGSPCAASLTHLQFSYCENLSDAGVIAILKNCISLQSLDLDNTTIGDAVLAEAAHLARRRSASFDSRPKLSLRLTVYDCQNITWNGVRHVLDANVSMMDDFSTIIRLKCFYGWQRVVDAHTRRIMRGEYERATKIEREWVAWMSESRGRRRTQMFHGDATDAEDEDEELPLRRRRMSTRLAECLLM